MRATRAFAAIAVLALVATACGSSTTAPPSSAAGSQPAGGEPSSEPASAAPTAAAGGGAPVELRWYCCLGGGEAPEQKKVEDQVVAEWNAAHPDIHVTFEVVTYEGNVANETLATELQAGNGPDVVGPVGIGGANAFKGQWLDLAPLIEKNAYDLSGFPESVVDIYKLDEGQVGIPFAIYPSALFYRKGAFEEAGLSEPPHKYGEPYTMPDGSQVEWNYDTARQVGKLLTVDKAGKDATQPGFDPKKISQWGFELQRDDMRGTRRVLRRGHAVVRRGREDRPDPGRVGGRVEVLLRRDLDRPHEHDRAAVPVQGHQPERLPVLHRQRRHERELPVVDVRRRPTSTTGTWRRIPAYNGKQTSVLNADTFRILKSTKHPDEAFQFLTYLLGDAAQDLTRALRRYSRPGPRTRRPASRRSRRSSITRSTGR